MKYLKIYENVLQTNKLNNLMYSIMRVFGKLRITIISNDVHETSGGFSWTWEAEDEEGEFTPCRVTCLYCIDDRLYFDWENAKGDGGKMNMDQFQKFNSINNLISVLDEIYNDIRYFKVKDIYDRAIGSINAKSLKEIDDRVDFRWKDSDAEMNIFEWVESFEDQELKKYVEEYEFQKMFLTKYPESVTIMKGITIDEKITEEFAYLFEGGAMGFFSMK